MRRLPARHYPQAGLLQQAGMPHPVAHLQQATAHSSNMHDHSSSGNPGTCSLSNSSSLSSLCISSSLALPHGSSHSSSKVCPNSNSSMLLGQASSNTQGPWANRVQPGATLKTLLVWHPMPTHQVLQLQAADMQQVQAQANSRAMEVLCLSRSSNSSHSSSVPPLGNSSSLSSRHQIRQGVPASHSSSSHCEAQARLVHPSAVNPSSSSPQVRIPAVATAKLQLQRQLKHSRSGRHLSSSNSRVRRVDPAGL